MDNKLQRQKKIPTKNIVMLVSIRVVVILYDKQLSPREHSVLERDGNFELKPNFVRVEDILANHRGRITQRNIKNPSKSNTSQERPSREKYHSETTGTIRSSSSLQLIRKMPPQ